MPNAPVTTAHLGITMTTPRNRGRRNRLLHSTFRPIVSCVRSGMGHPDRLCCEPAADVLLMDRTP